MNQNVSILSKLNISIPEDLVNYLLVRKQFYVISLEKSTEFSANFYTMFSDMDDLAENGLIKGFELIKAVIEVAVGKLVSKGLYDMNIEYFTDKFVGKYFQWENDFQTILDQYAEICLDEKGAKEYRENRKNNRSKWGVLATNGNYTDALEAKATTGLWNIADGIGHSFINAIGNASSKATAKKQKRQLYEDEKTVSFLTESIHNNCLSIHFALIDALNQHAENSIISTEKLLESEDLVTRLLDNLEKDRIPSPEINNMLAKIIVSYPFLKEFYAYLLSREVFNSKEVVELANYFSVDIYDILFEIPIVTMLNCMNEYDLEKRTEILVKLNEIGVTNTEFDVLIKKLNDACLNYNNIQYEKLAELEPVIKEEDILLSEMISKLKRFTSNDGFYLDDIPIKKKNSATLHYEIPLYEKIVVLIDNTVFGSAKKGIAFCKTGMFTKTQEEPESILYKDINKIEKMTKTDSGVNLIFKDYSVLYIDLSGSDKKMLDDFILIMAEVYNVFSIDGEFTNFGEPETKTNLLESSESSNATQYKDALTKKLTGFKSLIKKGVSKSANLKQVLGKKK